MDAFKPLIGKVATGAALSRAEAERGIRQSCSRAKSTPAQMGAFLMALRCAARRVEEITGAVARHARARC